MQRAELYERVGDRWGLARALAYWSWMAEHLGHFGEAQDLGRYTEAQANAEQGAAHASRVKHRLSVGFSQFVSGLATLAQGEYHEALTCFQESVAAFEEVRQQENRVCSQLPLVRGQGLAANRGRGCFAASGGGGVGTGTGPTPGSGGSGRRSAGRLVTQDD